MLVEAEITQPRLDQMLRGLGAWLDTLAAPSHFSLFESPQGFTAITGAGMPGDRRREMVFTHETLMAMGGELRARRGQKVPYSVPWRDMPGSREDFLRALGYELDDSRAARVIVDELPDSVLLTYSYVNPSQGVSWRKHIVKMAAAEMDEILEVARSRRARGATDSRPGGRVAWPRRAGRAQS
jgi:hypothetical protein